MEEQDREFMAKHAKQYALSVGCLEEDAEAYAKFYVWYHEEHGIVLAHAFAHTHPAMFPNFRDQTLED